MRILSLGAFTLSVIRGLSLFLFSPIIYFPIIIISLLFIFIFC